MVLRAKKALEDKYNKMEQKKIFGNIRGGFNSIKEEISHAKLFLADARLFFDQKTKESSKTKKVFTKQMSTIVQSRIIEIENIVSIREIDIDSFLLYKLRNSIKTLKDYMDYIIYLENL